MSSEEFYRLVKLAEIADIDYPVSGANIILPYGKKIFQEIENKIVNNFLEMGYQKTDLPEVLPESFVKHLKPEGLFKSENEFSKFYLCASYDYPSAFLAKLMIKSKNDMPLKVFCLGRARRQNTKKALIKDMEFWLCEFNSFFQSDNEASKELEKINKTISKILQGLKIPFFKVKESDSGQIKFYTYFPFSESFGSIFCSIMQNTKYTKDFFPDKNLLPIQVNFSATGRMLAAYLANCQDAQGFALPKELRPYDVCVPGAELEEKEISFLTKGLDKLKLHCLIKKRDNSKEFYKYFMSTGIPVMISSGKNQISVRSRNKAEAEWVNKKNIFKVIKKAVKHQKSTPYKNIRIIPVDSSKKIKYEADAVYSVKQNSKILLQIRKDMNELGILDSGDIAFVAKKY